MSIVITNFNYGLYLAGAIDSALAQTYENREVIVVDDGSTDNSREIIADYRDRVVPVLQQNGGQGSGFNAGFAASRGEIVCFLDADDALYPDALARAAPLFDDERTAKVHWPLEIVDAGNVRTGRRFPDGELLEGNQRDATLDRGPLYDSHCLPPTSGNAWRRWFLEQVLPMPAAEFDHGADVYLHTLAPLYGAMRAVREPLGLYRAHGANHYWRNPLTDTKVSEYLGRFASCCKALEKQLAAQGHKASRAQWEQRNFNYLWLTRLRAARQDLETLIAPGESYILIDGDEWGARGTADRQSIPFLERDGDYWGAPADDDEAIRELERLRLGGARYVVFWWTSFWWFEHYAAFTALLHSSYPCVLRNDRLVVFEMAPDAARIRQARAVG